MSLLRQGKAQALTIYLGESDQWHGMTLYVVILQYLREQGCAGATVTRAVAGYGAGSRLHMGEGWRLSSDASVVIQVVDQPERLQRLLPHLREMLSGGLMTLHEVEVLKYTHARTRGLPTHLPVQQIMEPALVSVNALTPLSTVIDLLLAAPFRALPVIDEQKRLQGIISTGDLIKAGIFPVRRGLVKTALALDEQTANAVEAPLAQGRQSDLTAQVVMNRQVRTVGPDTSIREAGQIMVDTGLRRLPVVAGDGTLLGMLTRADMLQVIVTSPLMSTAAHSGVQSPVHTPGVEKLPPQERPVGEYATSDVTTVGEQASLSEIIDALILSPFKRVIVVDGERHVKGVIGDVDVLAQVQAEGRPALLRWFASRAQRRTERLPTGALRPAGGSARIAAELMNREVVMVTATTTMQETIERMMTSHRKVLPVVDAEQRLVGVVGRTDVLRILLEG